LHTLFAGDGDSSVGENRRAISCNEEALFAKTFRIILYVFRIGENIVLAQRENERLAVPVKPPFPIRRRRRRLHHIKSGA